MTRLVIITRAFPFPPGEQFISPEAPYWVRDGVEVTVMPFSAEGQPRLLPDGVTVDPLLSSITAAERAAARRRALRDPQAWHEFGWLLRHGKLSRAAVVEVARAVSLASLTRDRLRRWAAEHGQIDVVYAYWFDAFALGAVLAKQSGDGTAPAVRAVAARVHGYDLYEERHPARFHALKRRLAPGVDLLLPIAQDGAAYARHTFGFTTDRVVTSPLGVALPTVRSSTSGEGTLEVVSTAQISSVKRVDRLADAMVALAGEHPDCSFGWTHFGGGDLLDEIRSRVVDAPSNLRCSFAGSVDNETIREHLATRPCDVFVNTSASEGVPVSIMEAMAFGVPALAPAVGGIGELVPSEGPGGRLFTETPDAAEVARTLWQTRTLVKSDSWRSAAAAIVAERYDEAQNYTELVDRLVALAGSREQRG